MESVVRRALLRCHARRLIHSPHRPRSAARRADSRSAGPYRDAVEHQEQPSRRSHARIGSGPSWWSLALIAVVCLSVTSALGGVLVVNADPTLGVVHREPLGQAAQAPRVTAQDLPLEVGDPIVRRGAIEQLLRIRANSVVEGLAKTWAAEQVEAAQVPDFLRLQALSPRSFSYDVSSIVASSDPTVVDLAVTLSYRLAPDNYPATLHERLTLNYTAAGWRISREVTCGSRVPMWELGDLAVVHGAHSTVIGIDLPASRLSRYADLADAVVPSITASWGQDWAQDVVIVVPSTADQLAKGLDRSLDSLGSIAAVTTVEGYSAGSGATRVWLNTPILDQLSELGRQIVLRHELVHVATGSAATESTPLWLEEGLAEYIGYLGTGVSLDVAARDALDAIKSGAVPLPTQLPTAEDFAGPHLTEAYETALIACDLLAGTGGAASLVKIYRDTALGTGSADENVSAAMKSAMGLNLVAFQRLWTSRIADLAQTAVVK